MTVEDWIEVLQGHSDQVCDFARWCALLVDMRRESGDGSNTFFTDFLLGDTSEDGRAYVFLCLKSYGTLDVRRRVPVLAPLPIQSVWWAACAYEGGNDKVLCAARAALTMTQEHGVRAKQQAATLELTSSDDHYLSLEGLVASARQQAEGIALAQWRTMTA